MTPEDQKEFDELNARVAAAGAVDPPTALLVAKARLADDPKADVDACVAAIRKDKPFLFQAPAATRQAVAVVRTASYASNGSA